jgi:hypothetical protein
MSDGVFASYAQVLEHKRVVLARIRRALAAMEPEHLVRVPPGGGWSVAGVLEHLALVGESVLAVVEKLLARAAASGSPPAVLHVDLSRWVEEYRGKSIKTRAPFEPTMGADAASSLARLEAVTRRLEALEPRVAAVDPASTTFRHWVFGPLSLGEWLVFLGLHEERHLQRPPFAPAGPERPIPGAPA